MRIAKKYSTRMANKNRGSASTQIHTRDELNIVTSIHNTSHEEIGKDNFEDLEQGDRQRPQRTEKRRTAGQGSAVLRSDLRAGM